MEHGESGVSSFPFGQLSWRAHKHDIARHPALRIFDDRFSLPLLHIIRQGSRIMGQRVTCPA